MKISAKRLLCVLLSLIFIGLPFLQSAPTADAAEEDLAATIEEQIRAYARSINQSNADDTAAWALATHGITGRGRKLEVGESHALTATLMNAELALESMTVGCSMAIKAMQQMRLPSLYIRNSCIWNNQSSIYGAALYYSEDSSEDDWLESTGVVDYTGSTNAYDQSLVWMSGSTAVRTYITRANVTEDTVTYDVRVLFFDRFDFSTGSGSVPSDIASLLGSFLFREFDWTATAQFQLTVPNTCAHEGANYHVTYDAVEKQLVWDTSNDFAENSAQNIEYTSNSKTYTYFSLDRAIQLYHDHPWVLEYTVSHPKRFALTEVGTRYSMFAHILNLNNTYLFIPITHNARTSAAYRAYYGTALSEKFPYNSTDSYTLHLENVLNSDGSNMIYLTVHNNSLEETVLQPTPMDDYYLVVDGRYVLQETDSTVLSGVDLSISLLGDKYTGFHPPAFEMRVWENGQNSEDNDYFSEAVVPPTCSSQGYTTYTCECGYSYNGNFVDALPHNLESVITEPTCTESGYTTHTCTACGHSNVDSHTEPLGHDYVNGTCTRCGVTSEWVGKVSRLSGSNRYETGFAVANQLKANLGMEQFETVIVAYGQNFPDALTGSYLASVKNAPILLTEPSADAQLLTWLRENLIPGGKVYILGGTSAVSQAFEDGAINFGFDVTRLKGAGRYETNLAILAEAGVNTTDEILIATGKNYADSLSASATGLPMLLVDKTLTEDQKAFLENTSKNFVILGGTGAVSSEIEAELAEIGTVTRVKGSNRYETSVEIAKRYFENPQAVVLAYAQGFPDGLCGGPLALSMGAPLILTSNENYAVADDYIEDITTGAVTGGTGRISDETVRNIFDLPDDAPIVKP